jgi:hypothetical protein
VSEAGGLGSLSLHGVTPDQARYTLRRLTTRRTVLLTFTGSWERDEVLDVCLAAGYRYFQVFWWNAARLVPRIRAAGGVVFQQVGTLSQADDALSRHVDGLFVQCTRAGGPVRSPLTLETLLPELRARFSGPIIAGGGLATRDDTHSVLDLGADAALFGTRFLLSDEADAPLEHKRLLTTARAADLTLDTRLVGDWPCSPRRRLITRPDNDQPGLQAGLGLDAMDSVLPAAELVRQLMP